MLKESVKTGLFLTDSQIALLWNQNSKYNLLPTALFITTAV